MFTVSCKNDGDGEKIKNSIRDIATAEMKADKVEGEITSGKTTLQAHSNAKKVGISSGKLILIEQLQKKDTTIKTEDYKNASIKDIKKAIVKAEKDEVQMDNNANIKDNKGKGINQQDKQSTKQGEDKNKNNDNSNSNNSKEIKRDKEEDKVIKQNEKQNEKQKQNGNEKQNEKQKDRTADRITNQNNNNQTNKQQQDNNKGNSKNKSKTKKNKDKESSKKS